MARSQILTGARIVLYINGKPYAQVSHFRWDSATPKKAIYGLDQTEPFELAPGITKITGSLGLYRLARDGGLEGSGITHHFADIPREKYFTLALVDLGTDTQIFWAGHCSVVSQSWDVPTRGIVTGQMAFEALAWNNEAQHH